MPQVFQSKFRHRRSTTILLPESVYKEVGHSDIQTECLKKCQAGLLAQHHCLFPLLKQNTQWAAKQTPHLQRRDPHRIYTCFPILPS